MNNARVKIEVYEEKKKLSERKGKGEILLLEICVSFSVWIIFSSLDQWGKNSELKRKLYYCVCYNCL